MATNGAGVHVDLDEQLRAYVVSPADHVGAVATGVVLLHDAFGPHRNYCYALADCISEYGYKVIVPELFDGSVAAKSKEEEESHEWTLRLSLDNVWQIVRKAVGYMTDQEAVQTIASFGIGFGGELSLMLSSQTFGFNCCIALSPTKPLFSTSGLPTLCVLGGRQPFVSPQEIAAAANSDDGTLTCKLFPKEGHAFAYGQIADEDTATQALAHVLDFLAIHLQNFKPAACTSDGNPWWPQGKNGPFFNVGYSRWLSTREKWRVKTQERPPKPKPVAVDLILEDLSSVRRTYDLPGRMTLPDIVEVLVDIWDV